MIGGNVTPTADDCLNIREYCQAFNVECPDSLENAMQMFEANINETTAEVLKVELCKWLVHSTHGTFQEALWQKPKESAREYLEKKNEV